MPVDFAASGVDALTLAAHKLGGPYGVGALVARRELGITPLVHGGGQQRGIRSGAMCNAHLQFPDCEGDSLLMLLDACGIEVSIGSACSAGVPQASHVLLAMGLDEAEARSCLRLSLGHTSTQADVDAFVDAMGPVVEHAGGTRRLSRWGRKNSMSTSPQND